MNAPHVLKDMPENATQCFQLSNRMLWLNHAKPQQEIMTLPVQFVKFVDTGKSDYGSKLPRFLDDIKLKNHNFVTKPCLPALASVCG